MKVILFFLMMNIAYSFEVEVTQIREEKPIYLLVFNQPEGFPYDESKSVFSGVIPPTLPTTKIDTNLKSGEYTIVIYQDTNDNKKLDLWFFGKPKEPFGVSNSEEMPRRTPTYEKYKKYIDEDEVVEVKLWQP